MIAAQLYTVRERLQDKAGLADVLDRLSQIGYGAVEVAGLAPAAAEHLDVELRRTGLLACAAHVPLESLQDDLDAVAGRCLSWGCRYVVVPSLPIAYHSAAGVRRFAAEAAAIAGRLHEHRLRLAYHNHAFELEFWEGRPGLEALFDLTAPDVLSAELDTYWLQFGGASPASWMRRLAGRVPLVHLKDLAVVDGRTVQVELGAGSLNWAGILAACRAAGTEWLVVEQDESAGDPVESLASSHRNLTRMLAASGAG